MLYVRVFLVFIFYYWVYWKKYWMYGENSLLFFYQYAPPLTMLMIFSLASNRIKIIDSKVTLKK